MEIKDTGYIFRKNDEIYYSKKNKNNMNKLLKIIYNKNNIEIKPNKFEVNENGDISSLNSAWFINNASLSKIKSLKYKCNKGDIVKFGKIKFIIKKIFFQNNNNNNFQNSLTLKSNHSNQEILNINNLKENETKKNLTEKISQKKQKTCRICYTDEEDVNNPLIQPCLCTGSLKYVHLFCLKKWINTKFYIKKYNNSTCISYLAKQAECELCKSIFPDYTSHNDKLFEIKSVESNFSNYLILESLTLDINKYKIIYIVSLDNPEYPLKIGRAKDSNILISDITVSRFHCKITIDDNGLNKNVYIEDNNSKFGTLILIKAPKINLCENLGLNIQVGRSFLNCKIKQKINLFKCCQANDKPDIYYYYKQNTNKEFISKTTVKTEINTMENNSEEEEKTDNQITNKNKILYEDIINIKNENKNNIQNEKEEDDEEIIIYDENKSNIQNNDNINNNDNLLQNNEYDKNSNNDINVYEASFEEENIPEIELNLLTKKPQKPNF